MILRAIFSEPGEVILRALKLCLGSSVISGEGTLLSVLECVFNIFN